MWIHELYFVPPSATVWFEVRSISFMLFGKLLPICKGINSGVLKMMSFWSEWFPSTLSEVCLLSSRSLFHFAVTILGVKRTIFITPQHKYFEHLILFFSINFRCQKFFDSKTEAVVFTFSTVVEAKRWMFLRLALLFSNAEVLTLQYFDFSLSKQFINLIRIHSPYVLCRCRSSAD